MQVTTFAVDLAKQKFQVHGFTAAGERVVKRTLSRAAFLQFFAQREERCRVVMEACGSSHHWGRELRRLGYSPELLPAQFTKPFVIGNKHDGNDTDAIFEASLRPKIRCVTIKSEEHQAVQSVHRVRQRLIGARTALSNQLRGMLGEYGYAFARGAAMLRRSVHRVLEEDKLPGLVRELVNDLWLEWCDLNDRIAAQDRRLMRLYRASALCQRLGAVEGIGEKTATAVVAAIPDPHAFRSGRQCSAWIGLTPGEHSSGQVRRLGGITKRGDRYLRTLLIHGGRAAVNAAMHKSDPRSEWIKALVARRGKNKAAVAVANKNARIIWALLSKEEDYRQPLVA